MTDIIKAIKKINPNAEVTVNADDINQITWLNGTTPISKADIEAKMVEVQADYDAKQYQRDRVYPSIGDQLDMLWHTMDKDNELQHKFYDFYQTIKKVKVAHPKK
jgi:copper chaperone CopZ